jgi:hypothetical protein
MVKRQDENISRYGAIRYAIAPYTLRAEEFNRQGAEDAKKGKSKY